MSSPDQKLSLLFPYSFDLWLEPPSGRDTLTPDEDDGNFKSLLQQYSQEHFNATPSYVLLDEKGPDHNKCFELEVTISDRHFPSAWGSNKKEAEQKAASNALVELGVLENTTENPAE